MTSLLQGMHIPVTGAARGIIDGLVNNAAILDESHAARVTLTATY
jgi:hypothetical protein